MTVGSSMACRGFPHGKSAGSGCRFTNQPRHGIRGIDGILGTCKYCHNLFASIEVLERPCVPDPDLQNTSIVGIEWLQPHGRVAPWLPSGADTIAMIFGLSGAKKPKVVDTSFLDSSTSCERRTSRRPLETSPTPIIFGLKSDLKEDVADTSKESLLTPAMDDHSLPIIVSTQRARLTGPLRAVTVYRS